MFQVVVFAIVLSTASAKIQAPGGQIINGVNAVPGEAPYLGQVLDDKKEYICVAVLIHPMWALALAYQINGISNLTIRFGSMTIGEYESHRVEYYVKQTNVYYNPAFTGDLPHSLALIKMSYPVALTPRTSQPVRVNTIDIAKGNEASATYVGAVGKMCGWGVTRTGATALSQDLKCRPTNPVLSFEACNKTLKDTRSYYLNPGMICSGHPSYADPNVGCDGDGASPFVVNRGGRSVVIGALAWVWDRCGFGPEGHLKVAYYYNWIRGVTGNAV